MKCPKCKRGVVMQQVSVFVECSADRHSLNKKSIRSRDVKIKGAGWPTAVLFCDRGCGYGTHSNEGRKP